MTRLWPDGRPVEVLAGADGAPYSFHYLDASWQVAEVCNRWRTRQGWWREEGGECYRDDWKILTHEGLLCLLVHDLRHDGWTLERVYD
jgi:hypothetical protein